MLKEADQNSQRFVYYKTEPSRGFAQSFMLKLTDSDIRSLSPAQRGIVLSVHNLVDDISVKSFCKRLAKLVPLALLVGDNVRMQRDINAHLRNFLNCNEVNFPIHSPRKTMNHLTHGLYLGQNEHGGAMKLAGSLLSGTTSMSHGPARVEQDAHLEMKHFSVSQEEVAHNVAMKLKNHDEKFNGDLNEC